MVSAPEENGQNCPNKEPQKGRSVLRKRPRLRSDRPCADPSGAHALTIVRPFSDRADSHILRSLGQGTRPILERAHNTSDNAASKAAAALGGPFGPCWTPVRPRVALLKGPARVFNARGPKERWFGKPHCNGTTPSDPRQARVSVCSAVQASGLMTCTKIDRELNCSPERFSTNATSAVSRPVRGTSVRNRFGGAARLREHGSNVLRV